MGFGILEITRQWVRWMQEMDVQQFPVQSVEQMRTRFTPCKLIKRSPYYCQKTGFKGPKGTKPFDFQCILNYGFCPEIEIFLRNALLC